ncbi:glycosyltransferase [Lactococcus insecticola]|uniref:Glycosyl transferase n=1 Tax=Pseudolactococcus insecticola TaxID=2709158 RepID=A0A6A0B963_9LACT|nr:glycosyltransferase [Lactococcus insecticola]GFH40998.1 glycosyl transferase [Lactococcus insecticola]
MKKLLFLSPVGGWTNGADIAMNHQMQYLKELGYEIVLVTLFPNTEKYSDFLAQYKIKSYRLDYTWWRDDNLADHTDSVTNMLAIEKLTQIIRDEQIDVAITNTANIPQLSFAAAANNIPHLWLIHEFPEGEFSYTKEKYDYISRFSNELLASSDKLQEQIEDASEAVPVSHFYPYTDVSELALLANEGAPRLISVNAITGDRKNTLELIKIYQEIKVTNPTLELVITGDIQDNDYYELLKNYIQKHALKDISFTNDREKNWSNVKANDIYINTSKQETFGLTMIESLKLGVVQVASSGAAKAMIALGYLDEAHDTYELGDISDAVRKIKFKLAHFGEEQKSLNEMQARLATEQSLAVITKPLVDAIERYSENPQRELRYFKNMLISSGQEFENRLTVIEDQKKVNDERFARIDEQNMLLEERMAIITQQKMTLDERMTVIDDLRLSEQKLTETIIEKSAKEAELNQIKNRKLYKIATKLRLL